MKKLLFLFFILFAWQTLSAQDKIIATNGNVILCRIVSISNDCITYEQPVGDSVVGKIIQLSNVSEYFRDSSEPLSNEIYTSRRLVAPERPWLLSLSAGGAYMPWILDNVEENAENKKIKKGFSFNANAHHLITDHVGFGFQYSFFTSGYNSNRPNIIIPEDPIPVYSDLEINESQYINYAGLSVFFRQFLDEKRKFSFNETLGGGLFLYRAETQSTIFYPSSMGLSKNSYNFLKTGTVFGASFGLSVEYKILPYLSIGMGGNFMYGDLSRIHTKYKSSSDSSEKITNEKLESPIKLSRIDYSFVLRIQL